MNALFEILRHVPDHLQIWAFQFGTGVYFILAAILFAETGLVITPFLPGDSLLFATGTLLSLPETGLSPGLMVSVMILAVFCGDMVNYQVGRWMSTRLFSGSARWLNQKHLDKTKAFYVKHGGKTIILARFMPIVRTYAPFVAGLSEMSFLRFASFSFCGACFWIGSMTSLGYFFGNIPVVKRNFEFVVLAIVAISLLPLVVEYLKSRFPRESQAA